MWERSRWVSLSSTRRLFRGAARLQNKNKAALRKVQEYLAERKHNRGQGNEALDGYQLGLPWIAGGPSGMTRPSPMTIAVLPINFALSLMSPTAVYGYTQNLLRRKRRW